MYDFVVFNIFIKSTLKSMAFRFFSFLSYVLILALHRTIITAIFLRVFVEKVVRMGLSQLLFSSFIPLHRKRIETMPRKSSRKSERTSRRRRGIFPCTSTHHTFAHSLCLPHTTLSRAVLLCPSDLTARQWDKAAARLRSCCAFAFAMRLQRLDAETKKLAAFKDRPGWNFCKYFLLKECAGIAFQEVGRVKEALDVYKELEALFFKRGMSV